MKIYLAADRNLPLVDWNEADPGFYIKEIGESDNHVRHQFTKTKIYWLGSHMGCSCGFKFDGHEKLSEKGRL